MKDGLFCRVQSGFFISRAPYGYLNVRKAGRSLVGIDGTTAPTVRRLGDG